MIIATRSLAEPPIYKSDTVLVKQFINGRIKLWFLQPMTVEEYNQLLSDCQSKLCVEVKLKRGK